MNEVNTKKIFDRFDFFHPEKSPMQGLMCFGFEHGDGWFDILWEACEKLDNLIKSDEQYLGACIPFYKRFVLFFNIKRFHFKKMIYFMMQNNPHYNKRLKIKRFIDNIKYNIVIPKYETEPFEIIQVKEKFGSLRIYPNWYTDEITKILDEAEEKSLITCEVCGKEGKLRNAAWVEVLCENCHKK